MNKFNNNLGSQVFPKVLAKISTKAFGINDFNIPLPLNEPSELGYGFASSTN